MADNVTLNTGSGGSVIKTTEQSGGEHLQHVGMPQISSTANTQDITSSEASPASPWQGTWEVTQERGVVRILTTLYSASANPGTFIFEFSEDGVTADITETRALTDLTTVRFFDLLSVHKYYRCSYEPDSGLGGTTVVLATMLRTANDGAFVRLADQSEEKASFAAPQTFAYLKAFKDDDTSTDIKATDQSEILTSSAEANIGGLSVYSATSISTDTYAILVDLSDTTNFPHDNTGYAVVSRIKAALELASNSVGTLKIGVITRIDGTDADLDFFFVAPFEVSGTRRILTINDFTPNRRKLQLSSEVPVNFITNVRSDSVTAVNTGGTLGSPNGNITPAVGDVIAFYDHTSGSAWNAVIELDYFSMA